MSSVAIPNFSPTYCPDDSLLVDKVLPLRKGTPSNPTLLTLIYWTIFSLFWQYRSFQGVFRRRTSNRTLVHWTSFHTFTTDFFSKPTRDARGILSTNNINPTSSSSVKPRRLTNVVWPDQENPTKFYWRTKCKFPIWSPRYLGCWFSYETRLLL